MTTVSPDRGAVDGCNGDTPGYTDGGSSTTEAGRGCDTWCDHTCRNGKMIYGQRLLPRRGDFHNTTNYDPLHATRFSPGFKYLRY